MRLIVLIPDGFKNKNFETSSLDYVRRTQVYCKVKLEFLKTAKKQTTSQDQSLVNFLKQLTAPYTLVILDEKGKHFNSTEFSRFLEHSLNQSVHSLVFAVGGAHGYGDEIKTKAQRIISLSQLTFAHELAALVLCEQIYRGFTLLHSHPYHNA